ncbi:hypothetical protein OT109_10180 [Phycisphaeraceae bacterium D3-23]
MTPRHLIRNLLIGVVLSAAPALVCWGIAWLMVHGGSSPGQLSPQVLQTRQSYASIITVTGVVMTMTAYFWLLLYAVIKLRDIGVRGRHERKLDALRERGEIDF